ncbi:hypothetical protein AX769_06645 [Frondihabitans sp. PAMC 28766]|uniref:MarR family winged helix-turn-helix transcriptional regulator n=1 Tax=Frondihabitans sp. PAMC 28766 TaxID=1795630 RepID=UPI00078C5909|nr:MarR family transcriptional regulator [Frondihabitans sp. PAMC 28766]AMM19892.1 hypothetical protein AX769_06645 [Frondihabitans sp. PAMC 28766]
MQTATSIDVADRLITATGRIRRSVRRDALPGNAADDTNLTLSQEAVIGHLTRGGAMTTADLARLEGVRPQSMGLTVAGLEELGLIAKKPDPADARRSLLELTDAGVESRASARDRRAGVLAGRFDARLTPDELAAIEHALDLIDRVVDR